MINDLRSTIYNLICGAEIHIELKTNSKMFCGCKNDPFHADKPNIYTCPVCLGLPGALISLPNKRAIESVIFLGLALHCEIPKISKFDRKHYFYPDLPKGYQISQYDQPLCLGGYVDTSFGRVNLTRIHLEEDTAKLQHAVVGGKKVSLIDYNRSSVPLMEIVTEPDIHSPEQAKEFLKKVRDIARALGIADCDMEKGGMRLEANISLATIPSGSDPVGLPNYKVEVKNINSFRYFANSLISEMKRHAEILDRGEIPIQETRGYRADTGSTVSQRTKEDAADYRYFPEPDIPPLLITDKLIEEIRLRLPELPSSKIDSLIAVGISENTAKILVTNRVMMDYIDQVKTLNPKYIQSAAKDIVNKKIDYTTMTPIEYIKFLESKTSDKIIEPSILEPIIREVLAQNPSVVADYKAGKIGVIGFFVGAVMKSTGGKADASIVNKILRDTLI